MFVIRWVLGCIILFLNFVFSPKSPKLSKEESERRNRLFANMSLYQLPACPFCVKVRRELKRQGVVIDLKNISQSETHRKELIEQGGKRTVPCLKIEQGDKVQWLYESSDIIDYLREKVAA